MAVIIKVPCSSANIGPGFDVIGLALSMYLELHVSIDPNSTDPQPQNCKISYEGLDAEEVSLDPERNLISRTALYVLRCHDQRSFPPGTNVHIRNVIPLGRGLGSSGAAVVAGVALANEVGRLRLPKPRMLDYALMIERHPDNVAAALYGGFVGTYLNELDPKDTERKEIPLSEVLPEPAGGMDTGLRPPEPPFNIGHYKKFKWAKELKCIAVIPDFEVSTATAREVLPRQYNRADMVFNMQRIALLVTALGESPPDSDMIYEAMQDKVHQPYRKGLIPGLTEILHSVTPKSHPGLLGICLSGAGPTILALATRNFDTIAEHLIAQFAAKDITCQWKLLSPAEDGLTVHRPADHEKSIPPPSAEATPRQIPPNPEPEPEPGTPSSGEPSTAPAGEYTIPTTREPTAPSALTYAAAGVSITAGNALVERIKSSVRSTRRAGTSAVIGGFGGSFDLGAAGFGDTAPTLVQAIDGVGTKLKIASAMGIHSTVGIDLVAMNVNDLVVQGAEPISFLDYFACGKLHVDVAAAFVEGVAAGCKEAGCALLGGETAEMPGMYVEGEYDAAGAATGVIPYGGRILPDAESMREGDVLLGLLSNGLHSNGFSLVRRILEREGLNFTDPVPWSQGEEQQAQDKKQDTKAAESPRHHPNIGTALLTPTTIYTTPCLALHRADLTKGMAHITGGGLTENVPRMLPAHLAAELDAASWPLPPVLRWLKRAGGVSEGEFARTWNAGLGMVMVVPGGSVTRAMEELRALGEGWEARARVVGKLVSRTEGGKGCVVRNGDVWE